MRMKNEIREAVNDILGENPSVGDKAEAYCYLLCYYGWKKHKAIGKEIGIDEQTEREWFNNLKNNHYFAEGGKIDLGANLNDMGEISIGLTVMALVARGLLLRVPR